MQENIILSNLASFGFPVLVVFVAGIWYWNKRSQEIIPTIEKKTNELEKETIEFKHEIIALKKEMSDMKKDVENNKNESKDSKKKIYEMLDNIKESQAVEKAEIKNCLNQISNLVVSINSLQKSLNEHFMSKK